MIPAFRTTCLALAGIAVVSCGDGTAPLPPEIPAALDIISGDAQSGTAGAELAFPLVVRVLDETGAPIGGQVVNFLVTSGGGTVYAGASLTNDSGFAKERWTLGAHIADSQRVEARAIDPVTGEPLLFGEFAATAVAGAPDTVRIIGGDGQYVALNGQSPDSFRVRVTDHLGNPVAGSQVSWAVSAGGGVLAADTVATDADGEAASRLTAGSVTGTFNVTASAMTRSASFTVHVLPGPPALIESVGGDSQTGIVHEFLAMDPAVRITDAHGNPVAGVVPALHVIDGTVTSSSTDDSGVVRVQWRLGNTAGPNVMYVKLPGLDSVRFSATGIAGPPTKLVRLSGDGQTAPANSAVAVAPSVRVLDVYGNHVGGVAVHFASTFGGGSAAGADDTTDASGVATVGSWTLGAGGPNTLIASAGAASVSFAATAGDRSAQITVSIKAPTANALAGDSLPVVATVTSTHSLDSVRVIIGGLNVPLVFFAAQHEWRGTALLASLPRDSVLVQVRARDVNGAATDAFVFVRHDRKPGLVVSVDSLGVARPDVALTADCTDDGPSACTISVSAQDGSFTTAVASGGAHVGGTYSLAAATGRTVKLVFKATDDRGQVTKVEVRNVIVDASSHLTEIGRVDGIALDQRNGALLYRAAGGVIALRTLATGVTDTVFVDTSVSAGASVRGFVTPAGALFGVPSTIFPNARAIEWRGGTATDLGGLRGILTIRAAGDYVVYSGTNALVRRDVVSATDVNLPAAATVGNDVAANGDVAHSVAATYSVYRYHAGVDSLIAPGNYPAMRNRSPVTDGVNVVFEKYDYAHDTYAIVMVNDSGLTELSPPRSSPQLRDEDYAVNNGWIAFTRADATGAFQVWTRSPSGQLRQASTFSGSSSISALGDDGTVIIVNGARRYAIAPGGGAQDVMTAFGRVIWREGAFVALMNGSVLTLTP